MPKTCFVIGPIGAAGSDIRVHADDLIKYVVAPVLEATGYGAPTRADLMPEAGQITTQIIRELKGANLVIADRTGGNENVYYELCVRHVLRKPVIHMALEGTKLPFDVMEYRTVFFSMHSRRAEEAREELTKQIKRMDKGYVASNPV